MTITKKPSPSVRSADRKDLPEIVAIDEEAFSPYGTAEEAKVFSERYASFQTVVVVLEQGGKVVGYGCSEKWRARRLPALGEHIAETHDPNGRYFCITGMAVRTADWHKGYGTALLNALIGIAQHEGCHTIVLETTHAQGFYEKFGFRTVARRRQGAIELIVMEIQLIAGVGVAGQ